MSTNIWQRQIMITSFVKICKNKLFFALPVLLCLGMMPAVVSAKMPPVKAKPGSSNLCITEFDHGSVNWRTGKIRATGSASPSDKKKQDSSDYILSAAKADASQNLTLILKKIVLSMTADDPGHDADSSRDAFMAGIETIASDAKIAEQHYTSDRAMEVTLETSIFGGFLQLVLPDAIQEIPKIKFIGKAGKTNEEKQHKKENKFTGLIIDARGLGFHPVIYPVVRSEQGDKIYSALFISREYAVHRGICEYACTMDIALNSKRAGKNPIMIKALRKGGENNAFIIISSSDAEKIEKATEHYAFMKKCRVIIVLN